MNDNVKFVDFSDEEEVFEDHVIDLEVRHVPEEYWECPCDCFLFFITREGLQCPECGRMQNFDHVINRGN